MLRVKIRDNAVLPKPQKVGYNNTVYSGQKSGTEKEEQKQNRKSQDDDLIHSLLKLMKRFQLLQISAGYETGPAKGSAPSHKQQCDILIPNCHHCPRSNPWCKVENKYNNLAFSF